MGLGPQSPEELNVGASCGLGDESSRGGISVTLDSRRSHILHGAVAGDLARDPVRNRGLVRVLVRLALLYEGTAYSLVCIRIKNEPTLVRLVELVVLASDGGVGNVAVSSNEGRRGDEGESLPGSHFVSMRYSLLVSEGARKFWVERTIDNG